MDLQVLFSPWEAVPEAEQRSILAALQALADKEGEAVKFSSMDRLTRIPVVDLYAVRKDGDTLVVYYVYDFRIGRLAQSGSDWDDHYFHTGVAVCRGGQVLSTQITKDQRSIIEYEVPTYDDAAAAQQRRAAAVKAHWDEWWSLPFPFPGDPGPE